MEPHPQIAPVAFLLGTWAGEGRGEYPGITEFAYGEQVVFGHAGKPFLTYRQRTWALDDGRALHVETGYLRALPDGRLEWVLAHPTGIAEILVGDARDGRLRLRSHRVTATPTAKDVTAIERDLDVTGDELVYELRMAAVGRPLGFHLGARLTRQAPG